MKKTLTGSKILCTSNNNINFILDFIYALGSKANLLIEMHVLIHLLKVTEEPSVFV